MEEKYDFLTALNMINTNRNLTMYCYNLDLQIGVCPNGSFQTQNIMSQEYLSCPSPYQFLNEVWSIK